MRPPTKPGDKFGRLTVLRLATVEEFPDLKRGEGSWFVCECSGCGIVRRYRNNALRSGGAKSCGGYSCRNHGNFARRTVSRVDSLLGYGAEPAPLLAVLLGYPTRMRRT